MSPLLRKDGKLVKKGGKLVRVVDPACCECCVPPCPPLPPFCTVKLDPGSITGLADQQTNEAVAGMLALTIDSIPMAGLGYSKTYTPSGATSPITVTVVVGAGATFPSVSVYGSSLNWPVPGGVPSQPNGQFPPLLMSFGFNGNNSDQVMDVPGVCSGATFEFDAEDPDRAVGTVEDGRGSPWSFESNLPTLTVTFQRGECPPPNPLP